MGFISGFKGLKDWKCVALHKAGKADGDSDLSAKQSSSEPVMKGCNDGNEIGDQARWKSCTWRLYHTVSCNSYWSGQPVTRNARTCSVYCVWSCSLVPYCTSDSWSGTRAESNGEVPFRFMGAAVVHQVVEDLLLLGLRNASLLLLAGSRWVHRQYYKAHGLLECQYALPYVGKCTENITRLTDC